MGNYYIICLLLLSNWAVAQTTSFRYEGKIQGPGIPAGTLSNQSFSVSIERPDSCGGNLGLTAWTTTTANIEDGVFVISPSYTAAALAAAMNPLNNFGAGCSVPESRRDMVITWSGETFRVPLHDAPRASLSLYALNASAIGSVSVQSPLSCSSNQFLKFNSVNSRIECQSLVATDVPTLSHSQVPAAAGDVTGALNTTTVEKIRGVGVAATAPTSGQVLKYNGSSWAPAADSTGVAPTDATYSAKGILQVDTSSAVSGLTLSSGVLSLPNVIGAAGPIGNSSTIPVITFDQKGRLTAVSSTSVNDSTKLPLTGGALSGNLDMSTNSVLNATNLTSTNVSTRNLVLNDSDNSNIVTIKTPTNVTTNYSLELPQDDGTSGQILSTNGSGVLSWINAGGGGTVTNVTSANSYLSVATNTTTPVITANVGTTANTLAAGNDSRITNAIQSSAYSADVSPAASCTTSQTPYWNNVSDSWACQSIGAVSNATSAVNFSGSLAGDVSGTQGATSVDKIKGKTVSAATANNQIMIYDGTNWVNNVVSGDATLANTGALTLASMVTAGSTGSASAVPTITYDAKGRITGTSSTAYQAATAAQKGIVQIGSNISVSSGTISLSGSNVTTALGYTPVNKAGDTMSGTLGLYATASDPSTSGWGSSQKGNTWFNTTSNQVKYWDGSAIQALGTAGGGISSLGGQSGVTQTFAAGTAGNSPSITSSANVHTLNIPIASTSPSVTSGTISNSDYLTFLGKLTSPLTTKGDLITHNGSTHIRLPAGTDGQVLTADSTQASGLKWLSLSNNGDITDVFAGTGLIGGATSGSATLSVDVGTTSGKIVQVDGSNKLPAIDGSNLTNLTSSNLNGLVPISKGGTNSSAALSNGKVMVSSAGSIVEGNSFSTGNATNSFVIRDGTGSFAAAGGTFEQVLVKNGGSTVTLTAPNAFTSYNFILPPTAGLTGQALLSNGAGAQTSWGDVFVSGGNFSSGTATIGTTNSSDFAIETANTTRMTVLGSNGNVGIGTSAPTASLEVARNLTGASEAIIVSNNLNASSASSSIGFYNNLGQMGTIGTYSGGFIPGLFASRMNITSSGSPGGGIDLVTFDTEGDVKIYIGGMSAGNERLRINKAGQIKSSGPSATVTTCGTGAAIVGNDARGLVTTGSTATTSCAVTFNTAYSSAPFCTVSWNGTATTTGIAATTTTTTLTVTFSANSPSKAFNYICMQ